MKISKKYHRYINYDDESEIPWMVRNAAEIANSVVLIIAAQAEKQTIDDFVDVYRITCAALEQQMAVLEAAYELLEKANPCAREGAITVRCKSARGSSHTPCS